MKHGSHVMETCFSRIPVVNTESCRVTDDGHVHVRSASILMRANLAPSSIHAVLKYLVVIALHTIAHSLPSLYQSKSGTSQQMKGRSGSC
jgi:hypothetical protein